MNSGKPFQIPLKASWQQFAKDHLYANIFSVDCTKDLIIFMEFHWIHEQQMLTRHYFVVSLFCLAIKVPPLSFQNKKPAHTMGTLDHSCYNWPLLAYCLFTTNEPQAIRTNLRWLAWMHTWIHRHIITDSVTTMIQKWQPNYRPQPAGCWLHTRLSFIFCRLPFSVGSALRVTKFLFFLPLSICRITPTFSNDFLVFLGMGAVLMNWTFRFGGRVTSRKRG